MIEIRDPSSETDVADWIELTISLTEEGLSKSSVASMLEQASGEEPAEVFLTSVWRELNYRHKLYSPPFFTIEDHTVQPLPGAGSRSEYIACLLLSLFGVQGGSQLPAKLFERLTSEAIGRYLSGQTLVFGWPFDSIDNDATDEESQIKRKVKELSSRLCEKFCEAPAPRFKDRGMDVVGWIPFGESRSGQVVILLQCAAGHNWRDKHPVPVDAWNQYVHWANNPVKAYAVPCVITERDWHDQSKDKGILFDRIRILNLLSGGLKDKNLIDELQSWVSEQLSELNG
ncbi:MAG: hypothetical protein NTX75_00360 [Proteobacteria bacterium]|nr:hypothetical protein [Pseudomonadota bacterium]